MGLEGRTAEVECCCPRGRPCGLLPLARIECRMTPRAIEALKVILGSFLPHTRNSSVVLRPACWEEVPKWGRACDIWKQKRRSVSERGADESRFTGKAHVKIELDQKGLYNFLQRQPTWESWPEKERGVVGGGVKYLTLWSGQSIGELDPQPQFSYTYANVLLRES